MFVVHALLGEESDEKKKDQDKCVRWPDSMTRLKWERAGFWRQLTTP
jgi:hypothetical protein